MLASGAGGAALCVSVEEVLDIGDVGAGGAAVNKVHSYSYTTALSFV